MQLIANLRYPSYLFSSDKISTPWNAISSVSGNLKIKTLHLNYT